MIGKIVRVHSLIRLAEEKGLNNLTESKQKKRQTKREEEREGKKKSRTRIEKATNNETLKCARRNLGIGVR